MQVLEAKCPCQGSSSNEIKFALWLKAQQELLNPKNLAEPQKSAEKAIAYNQQVNVQAGQSDGTKEEAIASKTSSPANSATASLSRIFLVGGYKGGSAPSIKDLMERILNGSECLSACRGCRNFHVEVYNGTMLVGGIHAYEWDQDNSCPDWEG